MYHIFLTKILSWFRREQKAYALLLVACLFATPQLHAQQIYPVQVNTIIVPPYSPYMSDYVNSVNDKLIVNLLLRDIRASGVQVRLRVNIEGQGVKLNTIPTANTPIITLDGGVPERLSGTDLAPYFNPANLVLNGITAAQYQQKGGQLPEGYYRICFDVYEVKTGAKLSVASGCANAWIILNDPPLINFPDNNAHVAVKDPQYVTFQWTPRHKGSPNSAFNTEYVFQLVELLPGFTSNPQAAFLASTPLYETTTNNTMLIYGPGEPPLTVGRTYVFRVQAKSMVNGQEMDLFKNNGYSEIYSFIYQGTCNTPLSLTGTPKGSSRLVINWQGGTPDQQLFVLSYRKANMPDAAWFDETVNGNTYTISGLVANTAYEFKVRANCIDGAQSSYTEVQQATTAAGDTTTYKCGVIPAAISITNQNPLPSLKSGDEFTAGDFTVTLTKVQGSNGHFTGTGYVKVPYLNDAKIEVSFSNVLINTDYQLATGQVLTQYDANWSNIGDLDKYFEGGSTTGAVVTGKDSADITVPVVISKPGDIKVAPADTGKGVTLTITGSDGQVVTASAASVPVTVKDAAGNVYSVTKDSTGYKVTQIAQGGNSKALPAAAQLDQLNSDKATVRFAPHAQQVYAFDAWDNVYSKSLLFGAKYEKLSDNYYVPAKAIVAGKPDVVTAQVTIKDRSINPDSIYFITGKGTVFTSYKNADSTTYTVNIVGGGANDAQELYAVYNPAGSKTPVTLGKLLIASYEALERKVVLVPVNGDVPDVNAIAAQLNNTYDSIGVHWTVVVDDPFTDESTWDSDGDHLLNVSGSGIFSTETGEMKALHQAYATARGGVDAKAVYLFVLKGGKGAESEVLAGDMPRARQFGYLFTAGNSNVAATAAHELGHGVFHLKHTFDGYGFTEDDLKDNLMNYHDGARLTKLQWDAVHDPGVVWGVFDGDADAEKAIINSIQQLDSLRNSDGSYTFISLSGKAFTLKGNITQVSFVSSEDRWSDDADVPLGALVSFMINGKYYDAMRGLKSKQFLGYLDTVNQVYYTDTLSQRLFKADSKVNVRPIVGQLCIKDGKPVFTVFNTNYLDKNPDQKNVTAQNQASGPCQDVFFLEDYMQNASGGLKIYAQLPAMSSTQMGFLNAMGVQGDICGMNALYVMKSASLIRDNASLVGCVTDAAHNAAVQVNQDQQQAQAQQNTANPGYTPADNTAVAGHVQTMQEIYASVNPGDPDFLKYMYYILREYKQDVSSSSTALQGLDDQSIGHIIGIFNSKNGGGRTCMLSCLPLKLREAILDRHTDARFFFSDKESLMADLIETTPVQDRKDLLAYLQDNNGYGKLWSLYDDLNGGNSDRLISTLTMFLLQNNPVPDSLMVTRNVLTADNTTLYGNFLYISKDWDSTVNLDGTFNGRIRELKRNSIGSRTSGMINISFDGYVIDLSNNQIERQGHNRFTGNPYEYVRITVLNDYTFPDMSGHQIRSGYEAVVPAIWAYWLLDRQKTKENWEAVRIGLDGVGILASMVTMEPGPLMAVDVIMQGGDIGFTMAEDKIRSSGTTAQNDLLDSWNTVYGAYGLGMIGRTGLEFMSQPDKVARVRYAFSREGVVKKIAEIKSGTKTSLQQFATDLAAFTTKLQNLKDASFSTRNLFYSFLVSATLEINISRYATTLDKAAFIVSDAGQLAVRYNGLEYYIADIASVSGDANAVALSKMQWYDPAKCGAVLGDVASLKTVRYVDPASGAGVKELIVFRAEKGIFVQELNSFATYESMVDRVANLKLTNVKTLSPQVIERFGILSDEHLLQLEADLGGKYASDLKGLFEANPADLEIYDKLISDPCNYWELYRDGLLTDARMKKWASRAFFIDITGKGKQFEDIVEPALSLKGSPWYTNLETKFRTDFNKELSEYTMFRQVQMNIDMGPNVASEYFIADVVFVKIEKIGKVNVVTDMLVVETKLSKGTKLTDNQRWGFESDKPFTLRNVNKPSVDETIILPQTSVMKFSGQKQWYKIYDEGQGTRINGIDPIK